MSTAAASTTTAPFGVYVHFPFCRARCPYCDFATDVRQPIPHDACADAVTAEIARRAPLFANRRAHTLYFGGGTPGLWRADAVARVVTAVAQVFGAPGEVTIEINPGETDPAAMRALHAAGATRASLGLQSLDDATLRALGRLHDADDGRAVVRDARAAGFASISCDLILGAPHQSPTAFVTDVRELVALAPDHVSVYALTIEPGTPFGQMRLAGRLSVDADVQAAMYDAAIEVLEGAGYEHYEISNFARPGQRSRHNQIYWTGGEYLGLGVGAHSRRLLAGGASERFANPSRYEAWLAAQGEVAMHETLDAAATRREAAWLGLRMRDGVLRGALPSPPDDLVRAGLLEEQGDRVRLTRRGLAHHDAVGARFL